MLQAVELRRANNNMTLLTRPLPLYYSFLNLLRACFAMVQDEIPKVGHGLKYRSAADILECAATLCAGTFTTYLEANGATWASKRSFTLEECICRTPESAGDYQTITGKFAARRTGFRHTSILLFMARNRISEAAGSRTSQRWRRIAI